MALFETSRLSSGLYPQPAGHGQLLIQRTLIMIKTIVLGVSSAAVIGLSAYAIWKWRQANHPVPEEKSKNPPQPSYKYEKVLLEKLSYEHIIKCVEQELQKEDVKVGDNANLIVLPNKMAQECFDFAQSQGKPFITEEELTDDDRSKMVMVFITTSSDNMKDIVWGKVFVPNELADDFEDFVPSDKIYMRPIRVK